MAGLYTIQGDELIEFVEAPYKSEDSFQTMLEKFPALLAGDLINPISPRRWLLIKREAGVPDSADSGSRWSVDHLFVDQDGVLTLVEVKRSTAPRIRREVVGQMLDYAANSVVYWSVESIREQFKLTHAEEQDPESGENRALTDFLQGADEPAFWSSIKTNLQAGRIRMLFVADEIPKELRRIVEFLNVQMDPAEVLALEIKQFLGQGIATLVPTLIGQTAEAETRKGSGNLVRQWDEQSFLDQTKSDKQLSPLQQTWFLPILAWCKTEGPISWGRSGTFGSFALSVPLIGVTSKFLSVYSDGRVEFNFQKLFKTAPDLEKQIHKIARPIKKFFATPIGENEPMKFPNVQLRKLNDTSFTEFLIALETMIDQIKGLSPDGKASYVQAT